MEKHRNVGKLGGGMGGAKRGVPGWRGRGAEEGRTLSGI